MPELFAGAASVDITPPTGTPLSGHWHPRTAEGIDTPLTAAALTIANDKETLAFVGLDLIAITAEYVNLAREVIRAECDIPAENVIVACSHTHEAPYPCPLLGGDDAVDPAYMEEVVNAMAESVIAARERAEPAEVGYGSTTVPGICRNRRRVVSDNDVWNCWMLPRDECAKYPAAGPEDEELLALSVRSISGDPIALLWNFSLHAHVFSAPRISADYPWHVKNQLSAKFGEDVTCIFTAGACGDINKPYEVARQEVPDQISAALFELLGGMEYDRSVAIGSRFEQIECRLRDFSEFQEEEIARKLPSALEVARREWRILVEEGAAIQKTTLHAARIGDFALACVPGEYFCALGLDIKRRSLFKHTAVVELCDDYIGYIPTAQAFEEGGYELFNVRSSKVARGEGERMAGRLTAMLRDLKRDYGKQVP